MKLTKEQFLGIVRHSLTFLGGVVIAGGLIDAGAYTELTGAVITIAGVVWSYIDKRKK